MSLVDGLLGPEEPELGCDDCFAELDRYVELELAGQDPDVQLPGLRSTRASAPCGPPRGADRRPLVERSRT
jgi:hypothetical protein